MVLSLKDLKFENLTREWTRTVNINYLYRDINIDDRGIDYKQFIKLRFNSINNNHIADFYTINGWFLIWYLMLEGKSNRGCFIKTTINTIHQGIENKMTCEKIKKILLLLNRNGVIKLDKIKGINVNTPLKIFIPYGDDEYYQFKVSNWQGYKALPYDYVKVVLKNFTPEEWAVFTVLCVRWNDFYRYDYTDRATGDQIYKIQYNHYSFPSNEDIGRCIGKSTSAVNRYIKSLRAKSKILIDILENDKCMVNNYNKETGDQEGNKAKNLIHKIPLFDRVEYIYHHVISKDDRPQEDKEYNIRHYDIMIGTKRQYDLKKYDYYMKFYNNNINKFIECLNKKDITNYKSLNKVISPFELYQNINHSTGQEIAV